MKRTIKLRIFSFGTAFFMLLCCLATAESGPDGSRKSPTPVALKAAKVWTGTGQVHDDALVLLRGRQIAAVGKDIVLPAGCEVIDLGSAQIAPGLIDPFTALGAVGQNIEIIDPIHPEATAEDVFDRFHRDFERALAAGITSVVITPSLDNLVGGTAVAVKTAGTCACSRCRVLRRGGPLLLTLSEAAQKRNRAPTSRIGAIDLFKQTLARARTPAVHGETPSPRIEALVRGELDAYFYASWRYNLDTVIGLRKEYGLKLTLVGLSDAWEMIDELAAAGMPLILGPFNALTAERELCVPGRAQAAGLEIAFTSGAPGFKPEGLRSSAALAVRYGLERDAALQAMTLHAAKMAGIVERVGSLSPGKDADMVVFSGDPLDLSSKVLRVYVNGTPVYAGACCGGCCAESEVCP